MTAGKQAQADGIRQDSEAQALRIHMLGRFRLLRGDTDLQPDRWELQKAVSVFKYLVSEEGRWVSSDVLIELFWGEMDPERARNALRTTVYKLRHALEPGLAPYAPSGYVGASRGHYRFRVESPHWCDFTEFLRLAQASRRAEAEGRLDEAVARAEEAIALFADDFLPEDRFEDWSALLRERLREEYLDLVLHLSGALARTDGGARRAIPYLRAALDRAPEREDLQREMIAALAAVGNVGRAVQQYEAFRRWLAEEFGVEPSSETLELVRRIRRGGRPVPGPGGSEATNGRPSRPEALRRVPSPGAFAVDWRTFRQLVLLERRRMRRTGMPVTVALFEAGGRGLEGSASWDEAEAYLQATAEDRLESAPGGMAAWQEALAAQLRQGDVVCPLDPRRLAVLLAQADLPTARHVARRLVGRSPGEAGGLRGAHADADLGGEVPAPGSGGDAGESSLAPLTCRLFALTAC